MSNSSNNVWRVLARMRGNIRRAEMLFSGRKERAVHTLDPLPPGQRPQDIFAILLLTVGIAVVVFDVPTYPWLRSLPNEYRNAFRAFTDFGKADWILISTGLTCLFLLAQDAGRYAFRIRMAIGSLFTYAAFIFYCGRGNGPSCHRVQVVTGKSAAEALRTGRTGSLRLSGLRRYLHQLSLRPFDDRCSTCNSARVHFPCLSLADRSCCLLARIQPRHGRRSLSQRCHRRNTAGRDFHFLYRQGDGATSDRFPPFFFGKNRTEYERPVRTLLRAGSLEGHSRSARCLPCTG